MPYFHVGQKVLFVDEDLGQHRGFIVMSRPDHAGPESEYEGKFIWVVEREDNQQLYGLCINEKPIKILRFKPGDKVSAKRGAANNSVNPGEYVIHSIIDENDGAGRLEYHDYSLCNTVNERGFYINDDDLTYA